MNAENNSCERIGDRWFKTYHSIYARDVSGEIAVTRLPNHKGLVPSTLEKLELEKGCVKVCVSTPHYPPLIEGERYTDDEIMCLIDGLAFLEENLLVHGDIQPKNIVKTPEGLAMIDYTLVVSIYDTITVTQGYKDHIGEYHAEGVISRCNPTERAIFALGATLQYIGSDKMVSLGKFLMFSDNKPKSFAEILDREFLLKPRRFKEIEIDYTLYDLFIQENKSLYLLYNVIANGLPVYAAIPSDNIDSLEIFDNLDWIHDIPSVSGKFLTLYFLGYQCDQHEQWGDIEKELPKARSKILVATTKLDFIV